MEHEKNNIALVTTSYFGNIHYYSKFYKFHEVWIEANENFQKQSYRNRCDIYAANGHLRLTVPVLYTNQPKTHCKDVKIDYTNDWQKLHFKSIESAYRSAPFYEFFMDEFMFVFEQKEKYLFDLNQKIVKVILNLLQIGNNRCKETHRFIKKAEVKAGITDFRTLIHPKSRKTDPEFHAPKYHQVFEDKHGFIENLSVLDLLFNEGTQAINILKESNI